MCVGDYALWAEQDQLKVLLQNQLGRVKDIEKMSLAELRQMAASNIAAPTQAQKGKIT